MGIMAIGFQCPRLPSTTCHAAFHSYPLRLFDFPLYDFSQREWEETTGREE